MPHGVILKGYYVRLINEYMTLSIVALLATAIVSAVSSQLIFKYWTSGFGALPISLAGIFGLIGKILQSPLMLAGLFLYGLGFLAWIFLLSRATLSMVYPVSLSANIVLVLLLSRVFFHESFYFGQVLGVSLILVGIYFVFSFS